MAASFTLIANIKNTATDAKISFTLPVGLPAGKRLIAFYTTRSSVLRYNDIDFPGWTERERASEGFNVSPSGVYERISDGDDADKTYTITLTGDSGSGRRYAVTVYRVDGDDTSEAVQTAWGTDESEATITFPVVSPAAAGATLYVSSGRTGESVSRGRGFPEDDDGPGTELVVGNVNSGLFYTGSTEAASESVNTAGTWPLTDTSTWWAATVVVRNAAASGTTYSESMTLGGSADVTDAARGVFGAAMTLAGSGAMTQPGGSLSLSEAATLAASGALTATAGKLATGEIGLDGAAGASATAATIIGLAATLGGSLGLSATPALQMALAATLAATQGITTAASAVMGGTAELGAQGAFEALPAVFMTEEATLALGGGITAAGGARLAGAVALAGSLGADLAPAWRLAGTVDLGSVAGLDLASRQDAVDAIAFGAVATVSAGSGAGFLSEAVTIAGLLSATVAARLQAMAAAGLDLFGSADASARLDATGAISLDGTPDIIGAGGLRIATGAAFDVTAGASAEGGLTVTGSIALSGTAGASAEARGDVQGTVVFEATLDAAAASRLSIAEAISLAVQHAIDAVGIDPSIFVPRREIRLTGLMLGPRPLTGLMVLTTRLEGVKATRRPLIGRIS